MKRILFAIFAGAICTSAYAACPDGFDEIQLENLSLSAAGASCAAGQYEYYHVDDVCTGNLY